MSTLFAALEVVLQTPVHINLLVVVCITLPCLVQPSEDTTRGTSTGRVRGFVQEVLGTKVNTYYGIPFAKPPIGELRFKLPEEISPWDGVYEAQKLPNSCPQFLDTFYGDFPGSTVWNANTDIREDCLYLNVWAPQPRHATKMAVIVWIYGGGFTSGTSTLGLYNAKNLAAFANVVVFSLNYRGGAFGFLYLNNTEAPGNQGLFDQAMALKWIKTNAEVFGGDPNKITIWGESAGSASVSYHLLSEVSRDFFNYGIMNSASFYAPWAYTAPEEAKRRAEAMADVAGCRMVIPRSVNMNCLRNASMDAILAAGADTKIVADLDSVYYYYPFSPTTDGVFLSRPPQELAQKGQFKKTSILLGTVEDEGSYFLLYSLTDLFKNQEKLHISEEEYRKGVADANKKHSPVIQKLIAYEYASWPYDTDRNTEALIGMVGDTGFQCSVNAFATHYADRGQKVYYYYFTHRSQNNPWPTWAGVMHGYEVDYFMGRPLDNQTYSQAERKLSKTIMTYVGNFARTGNPNNGNKAVKTRWLVHDTATRYYLQLQTGTLSYGNGPRIEKCNFWDKLIPSIEAEIHDNPECASIRSSSPHLSAAFSFIGVLWRLPLSIAFSLIAVGWSLLKWL